jgi:hypothetical protein
MNKIIKDVLKDKRPSAALSLFLSVRIPAVFNLELLIKSKMAGIPYKNKGTAKKEEKDLWMKSLPPPIIIK